MDMDYEQKVSSLQELTGRESGIIIYGSSALALNWTDVDGLPRRLGPTGVLGLGEDIPAVAGRHGEIGDYLQEGTLIDCLIPCKEAVDDLRALKGGVVYDLGDVIVFAPDGWI